MKTTQKYGEKADIALSMWVKLARATDTVAILSGRDITRYGLTIPQFGILETLGHLGPMKICESGKKKLMTGGNMTVVIDNLEKLGLVERVRSKDDRRATLIQLTAKGRVKFDDIFVQHARCVEELVWSALDRSEIDQLAGLLRKLGTALKDRI